MSTPVELHPRVRAGQMPSRSGLFVAELGVAPGLEVVDRVNSLSQDTPETTPPAPALTPPAYPRPHADPPGQRFDLSQTFVEQVTANMAIRRDLSFEAHSVLVDNYSSQWLFVPAARRWVMPFTVGVILPLAQATSIADMSNQAPGSYVQAALTGTLYVTHVWYAAMLPPSAGSPVPSTYHP